MGEKHISGIYIQQKISKCCGNVCSCEVEDYIHLSVAHESENEEFKKVETTKVFTISISNSEVKVLEKIRGGG